MTEHDRTDWDDRAFDAALHELHGQRPPDLPLRVLLALQGGAADGPTPGTPPAPPAPASRSLPRVVAARLLVAAVLVLGAALAVWSLLPATTAAPSGSPAVAAVELRVLQGAVQLVAPATEGGGVREVVRGGVAPFAWRVGARVASGESSRCTLGAFGVVDTGAEGATWSVVAVETEMKQGIVVVAAATVSVVAGVVTWHMLTRTEALATGATLRVEARPDQDDAVLRAENVQLRERLQQLEQQLAQQAERVAAAGAASAPAPTPAVAAAVAEPEAPPPGAAPTFTDPRFAELLAGIDWTMVGTTTAEMGPMLVELAKAMGEEGAQLPMELVAKLQQLNGNLLATVPALLKAGLPGYGANGAYTHPLVVANSVASTLAAVGAALTPAQQASLAGLVRLYSGETQAIAEGQHDFKVEHLLAETEMKDRLYEEMAAQLTPEQRAVVFRQSGYDGADLFSTGLILRTVTNGIPASSPAEFARRAGGQLGEQLGLDEASTAKVREVLERSLAQAPELFTQPADRTERSLQMMRTGRTTAALRRQIEWMRELQRQVPLTAEQREKLRGMERVLVPLPR